MANQHPITPPPELERQWSTKYLETSMSFTDLVTEVARWGADQELEACCEWLAKYRKPILAADLKYVRRPKPPTRKEQAIEFLRRFDFSQDPTFPHLDIILKALEALPND